MTLFKPMSRRCSVVIRGNPRMTAADIASAYCCCHCDWDCRLNLLVGMTVGFEIGFEHAHCHYKREGDSISLLFFFDVWSFYKNKSKGSMDVYHR
jgi:hypothetical protein